MNRILAALAALALVMAPVASARADSFYTPSGSLVQGVVPMVLCANGSSTCVPVSSSNPMPISGSFSATLGGFQPTPSYSTLTVANGSSSRVAIPSGTVDIVYNTGSTAVSVLFGSSSVTATATNDIIQPNSWMAFTVPSGAADLAAWGLGGTSALVISGGSGLPTGAGGGSAGGGGGSNASVGSNAATAPTSTTQIGSVDGSGNLQPASAAHPLPVTAAADQTFSSTGGPISVADTGLTPTVGANNTVILTGTVTPNSYLTFTGFSGAQTGWLQCTGSYSAANVFGIETSGPDGGTTWTRQASFSSQFSGPISLTAATFLMVDAIAWTSGSPICVLRVSSNIAQSTPSSVGVPLAAISNTAVAVSNHGGRVTSVGCSVPSGSAVDYIQLYNAPASSVTPGTTPSIGFYSVLASTGTAGMTLPVEGLGFTTALSAAATTTATGGTQPAVPADCTFTITQ
jgi:hypothetical protein